MAKRVVLIVSGDTERSALPGILEHALDDPPSVDIRTAPHGKVTLDVAEKLIKAAYWEGRGRDQTPDKAVVLVDTDGEDPTSVVRPLREKREQHPRSESELLRNLRGASERLRR